MSSFDDLPYVISYPRSGSHWIRCMVELYTKRPFISRAFFYPDNPPLGIWLHDVSDLKVDIPVIYLHRKSIDVIFSYMSYYKIKPKEDIIRHLYNDHKNHLHKWLNNKQVRLVLTYERMKKNPEEEFRKILGFFGVSFNLDAFEKVYNQITKELVKKKTSHDPQVIRLDKVYELQKIEYIRDYGYIFED